MSIFKLQLLCSNTGICSKSRSEFATTIIPNINHGSMFLEFYLMYQTLSSLFIRIEVSHVTSACLNSLHFAFDHINILT